MIATSRSDHYSSTGTIVYKKGCEGWDTDVSDVIARQVALRTAAVAIVPLAIFWPGEPGCLIGGSVRPQSNTVFLITITYWATAQALLMGRCHT